MISPEQPLISCVMLTANRHKFAQRAIAAFFSQTWTNKELVIMDSGSDPFPVRDCAGVRFFRAPAKTIGELRNMAIERANGKMIGTWDDDDWSHPGRLAEQAKLLAETDCEIVGYRSMVFHVETRKEWWLYEADMNYAVGTSLFYKRITWEKRMFEPRQISEDNAFQSGRHVITASGHRPLRMIASHHKGNTSTGREDQMVESRYNLNWTRIKNLDEQKQLGQLLKFSPVW